jgi:hypothetical protein
MLAFAFYGSCCPFIALGGTLQAALVELLVVLVVVCCCGHLFPRFFTLFLLPLLTRKCYQTFGCNWARLYFDSASKSSSKEVPTTHMITCDIFLSNTIRLYWYRVILYLTFFCLGGGRIGMIRPHSIINHDVPTGIWHDCSLHFVFRVIMNNGLESRHKRCICGACRGDPHHCKDLQIWLCLFEVTTPSRKTQATIMH